MAMYCTNPMCQKKIEDRNKPCPHCGRSFINEQIGMLCVWIFVLAVSAWIFYMAIGISSTEFSILSMLLFALGIWGMYSFFTAFSKAKEHDQRLDARNNFTNSILFIITSTYNSTYANITIPSNPHLIYLENSEHCNCWLDNATLYITTSIEKLTERINNNPDLFSMFLETPYLFTLYEIPVENINYYQTIGDMYTETKLSGGGSDLSGALLGAAIAGNAGAVIGSRKGISSETIKHDERIVELKYNDNGQLKTVLLDKTAENVLKALLPEKEYSYIMFQRNKAY